MKRLLRRPAVLIPAAVLLSLGAGLGYAVWEQLDTSALETNERLLDELPPYPGAREIDRRTQTFSGEDGVPLPEGIVTTALFAPPKDTGQEKIVDFYVSRLTGWEPRTTALGGAFQVRRAGRAAGVGVRTRRRLPPPDDQRDGPRRGGRAHLRGRRDERGGRLRSQPLRTRSCCR